MVIDANLVPAIIDALLRAEFRTQKEAAWAVSNFTVGGSPEQVGIMSLFLPLPPSFSFLCILVFLSPRLHLPPSSLSMILPEVGSTHISHKCPF